MNLSTNIHQVTKLDISRENLMPSTDVTKIEVTDAEGQTFSLYLYHDAEELEIVHAAVNNRGEAWDKYMEALNKKLKAEDKEKEAWEDYIAKRDQ